MKFLSTFIIRIAVLTFAFFIIKKIFNDIDLLNFSSIFTLNNIFLILIAAFSLLSSVIIRSIRWRYLVYSKTNKIPHSFFTLSLRHKPLKFFSYSTKHIPSPSPDSTPPSPASLHPPRCFSTCLSSIKC